MAKFKKGESGNPRGRKLGSRHKATLAGQALLDGEAEALTRKAVELAQAGNVVALKLCLERLIPPRKDRPITLRLPRVVEVGDIAKALETILEAVAEGEITPGEAQAVAGVLDAFRKGLELTDLEARVKALEEQERR
jgi:hypothetical protein